MKIISQKVLDEETGELKTTDFKEIPSRTKNIKRGFRMVYPKYDEIMAKTLFSNKDIQVFSWITNKFTYQKVEIALPYSQCPVDISKSSYFALLRRLLKEEYLMKIDKGIYRLNPFIYLPYRADAEDLQREWNTLKKESHERTSSTN